MIHIDLERNSKPIYQNNEGICLVGSCHLNNFDLVRDGCDNKNCYLSIVTYEIGM